MQHSFTYILKPVSHLHQIPRPRHKKQSDYLVKRSSFTLIALVWLEIGLCGGRNWPYRNQALGVTYVALIEVFVEFLKYTALSAQAVTHVSVMREAYGHDYGCRS